MKLLTQHILESLSLSQYRYINEKYQTKFLDEATIKKVGSRFYIKGAYHVSDEYFKEFKITNFPYYFFSSKPIDINGTEYIYVCDLTMHKPFVFTEADTWSYPLWRFLTDEKGELIPERDFTKNKYDGYLGCPFEFWKLVYSYEEEYEVDQIPMLVQELNMGYDGVIIKDVCEGNSRINVDDYIVFDNKQIEIVDIIENK